MIKSLILKKKETKQLAPIKDAITELSAQMHIALDSVAQHTTSQKENNKKPWVLLLGPQGSGKTTLLANSNLSLISPTKKSLKQTHKTQHLDYWVGENAVFVDPAAKYCMSTALQFEENAYWQTFLTDLAKTRTPLFESVCLTIDLPTLLAPEPTRLENIIQRWQFQVQTLLTYRTPFALNLIITHCDHLTGFTEYFSTLSLKEQQDMFGFSLVDTSGKHHLIDFFKAKFSRLMQNLSFHLFNKLHFEPNLEKRKRKCEFVFQFEKLFTPLYDILSALPETPTLSVNNVFFCSAKQSESSFNLFSQKLKNFFSIEPQLQNTITNESHALFIHQALLKVATPYLPTHLIKNKLPKRWWEILSYPSAIALIFGFTLFCHLSYKKSTDLLNNIASNANSVQSLNWLSEINFLAASYQKLSNTSLFELHLTGLNQASNIKKLIGNSYHYFLKNQFSNYLNTTLKNQLKIQEEENSAKLYDTLQVYLMLTNQTKLNKPFVLHWFNHFWQTQLPKNITTQTQLTQYLSELFHLNSFNWTPDSKLIQSAQLQLQKQPLSQIGFNILQQNQGYNSVYSKVPNTISGISLNVIKIPSLYSQKNFSHIYNETIPTLATKLMQSKWVIEQNAPAQETKTQLTKEIQNLYVAHYLYHWQEALSKIKFATPTSYKMADEQINLLLNPQSPLWQFYQHVITVAKEAHAPLGNEVLSHYMPDTTLGKPMQQSLTALQRYINTIAQAPSPAHKSFELTKNRMTQPLPQDAITAVLNTANKMPTPLNQWMRATANNSWKLMLAQSQFYINALWHVEVVSTYNKTIANRYPIFKHSSDDISVDNFNAFFGPGGTLQVFFKDYLAPFINTNKSYWTLKKQQGQTLGLPQSSLDMLLRGSMIQKMYYTDNLKTPSFAFTLIPHSLSANSNQLILNVGGKMLQFLPGLEKPQQATWPGPDGNFVTLRFNDGKDNPTTTTLGTWAWLRLLDKANVSASTTDSKIYKIKFNLDDHTAELTLQADNAINPYLPDVLTAFRCPEKL